MSEENFNMAEFIEGSFSILQMATQTHINGFGLDKITRWSANQEQGEIIFHLANGMKASAPFQAVGSWCASDGTFLWAWDNPSIDDKLKEVSRKVRQFGEQHNYTPFTTPLIKCEQKEAWNFTAVAASLSHKMVGSYRCPMGEGGFLFVIFGEVSLVKDNQEDLPENNNEPKITFIERDDWSQEMLDQISGNLKNKTKVKKGWLIGMKRNNEESCILVIDLHDSQITEKLVDELTQLVHPYLKEIDFNLASTDNFGEVVSTYTPFFHKKRWGFF